MFGCSMGEPKEVWLKRMNELNAYQVSSKIMSKTSPKSIFMHCLPAFHGLDTEIRTTNCVRIREKTFLMLKTVK